jgi:hypothetical protein
MDEASCIAIMSAILEAGDRANPYRPTIPRDDFSRIGTPEQYSERARRHYVAARASASINRAARENAAGQSPTA